MTPYLRHFLLLAVFLPACASAPANVNSQKAKQIQPPNVAQANNQFGVELYAWLTMTKQGNIFISPASISTAFGLAYTGSRGETAKQIANVMHFEPESDAFHARLAGLLSDVQVDAPGQFVSINNAFFVDNRTVLEPEYIRITKTYYKAGEHRVNYQQTPERARETINSWVEDKTRGRIKDLLSKDQITSATRSVLVNTVYMIADWQSPFEELATQDRDFRNKNGTIKTPTLKQAGYFRRINRRGFQAIELPYQGGNLSMVIFLPNSDTGLAKFEKNLTSKKLDTWLGELSVTEQISIDLQIPKLKFEDKYLLGGALENMGMEIPFSDFADFSGRIDWRKQPDGTPAKLDEIVHQTFLAVDEKGTEAAAATAVVTVIVTGARIPHKPPPKFYADHPYFFVIRHIDTGAVLFMGRVITPEL